MKISQFTVCNICIDVSKNIKTLLQVATYMKCYEESGQEVNKFTTRKRHVFYYH